MNAKSVLITGSGNGIGRAIAIDLARRGYAVAGLDREGEHAARTAADITNDGGTALSFEGDVTDPDSLVRAVDATTQEWGRLTSAVACAGVEVIGGVDELSVEQWNTSMAVNAGGVFNLAKAVLPQLLAHTGSFVAISSDAGTEGAQGYAAYAAAKHAVVGLVKSMALDYGARGVRSNVVCPAFVETEMAERIFAGTAEGEADFYRSSVPLGRFARPDEVAAVVTHLLSHEASYTNGMVYALDGGTTAGAYRSV